MKKIIENSVKLSGFVTNNAEIRQFTTSSVARFALTISRQEKNGEETNRVTSFINFECWRRNGHVETFDLLTKGNFLTVEAYAKPEEYVDRDGNKRNRLVWVATKFYPVVEQEEAPATENKD